MDEWTADDDLRTHKLVSKLQALDVQPEETASVVAELEADLHHVTELRKVLAIALGIARRLDDAYQRARH